MSYRMVAALIGLAFVTGGVALLVVTLAVVSPTGTLIPCGNGFGLGFDRAAAAAESPAYVDICSSLRQRRMLWATPIVSFGLLMLLGAWLIRVVRPRAHTHRR